MSRWILGVGAAGGTLGPCGLTCALCMLPCLFCPCWGVVQKTHHMNTQRPSDLKKTYAVRPHHK